ncbi:MAG: hypothetical protein U0894_11115 [Pirellulales bacterium]
MSDDHGYQAIKGDGARSTKRPISTALPRKGMRFDRCFVTNSICGPCRAVILTGSTTI